MNGQALLDVLREVFHRFGYEVRNASYRFDLEMTRDGEELLVKCGDRVDVEAMEAFIRAVRERGGHGLYISTGGGFSNQAMRVAKDQGIMTWDREDLELQIGRAILADIEGRDTQDPLKYNDNATIDEDEVAFWPEEHSLSQPQPEPQMESMDSMEPVGSMASFGSPSESSESMPVGEDGMVGARTMDLRAVPLRLGKDEALSMGDRELGGAESALLKLVPLWRYSFTVSAEREYKSKTIGLEGEGEGAINAITGEISDFPLLELVDGVEVPGDVEVRRPSVKWDAAERTALRQVIEKHTKEVQFNSQAGDALITESKVFKPREQDVHVELDLVYVPIWEVKGSTHSIEISGYDGTILDTPITDDAEFV